MAVVLGIASFYGFFAVAHVATDNVTIVAALAVMVGAWIALSWPRARATRTPWLLAAGPAGATGLYLGVAWGAYWLTPPAHMRWEGPASIPCGLSGFVWPLTTLFYCFAPPRA